MGKNSLENKWKGLTWLIIDKIQKKNIGQQNVEAKHKKHLKKQIEKHSVLSCSFL